MVTFKWDGREAWERSIEQWERYWASFKSSEELARMFRPDPEPEEGPTARLL